MTKITVEELVAYMDETGASQVKAAAHFGIRPMTVRTILHTPGEHLKQRPPSKLSERDVEVFDALCAFIVEHGWAPTIREICDAVDGTVNPIHHSVHKLAAYGLIVLAEGQPRAIRVVGSKVDMKGVPNVTAHTS